MRRTALGISVGMLLCSLACSTKSGPPDELLDAGPDSATADAAADAFTASDAGSDATADALVDAGVDATDAGPLTGRDYLYVFDILDVGAPDPDGDPTIVPGFDLDGVVSDGTEIETCRKPDFTSPPPDSEPGVDNSLGPALSNVESLVGFRAGLRELVTAGDLLVLLRVRGVDDLMSDDRVEVDVLAGILPEGVTAPLRTGARFEPGQTFDIDPRSFDEDMRPTITLPGRIVDGRLRAGPGDVVLELPTAEATVALGLGDAELRADLTAESLRLGVLGGALDVEETIAALASTGSFDMTLVRVLLENAADLDRVESTCTRVSMGLVFEGVEAVEGVVRAP